MKMNLILFSLQFVCKDPVDNKQALDQIMAWCWVDKQAII